MAASDDSARGVRGALATFVVLAAAAVVAYFPSWTALADLWARWSFGYDHGWLVAAVSAWLVWRQRAVLAAGQPCWPALALVLAAGFGWFLASFVDVVIGQQILLPVLLWLAGLTVFGRRAARALAFPLGFLYFAIPVWDFANPLLQTATVAAVGAWLDASGVPALLESNLVTIPAGRFEIASGCAGQAFFVAGGALAALFGHLQYRQIGRRMLLVAVALACAMAVNWVRVYLVILAGHLTDMQHYLVRVDHYTFGWAIFALALVPFCFLARRAETPAPADAPPATIRPWSSRAAPLGAVLGALALAPAIWNATEFAVSSAMEPIALATPEAPPGWQKAGADADWRPDYRGADAELGARYESANGAVDLWIVFYARQVQGRELVHYANRIAAPARWRIERTGRVSGGRGANEAVIVGADGTERLVRWWFDVGGRRAISELGAKFAQGAARLKGRSEAALIAMSARCRRDCEAAATSLDAFGTAIGPRLRTVASASASGSNQ